MVADDFTDASNDIFITKRTTDPANNLLRLKLMEVLTPQLIHSTRSQQWHL